MIKYFGYFCLYTGCIASLYLITTTSNSNHYNKGYSEGLRDKNKSKVVDYINGYKKGIRTALKQNSDTIRISMKDLLILMNDSERYGNGEREKLIIHTED